MYAGYRTVNASVGGRAVLVGDGVGDTIVVAGPELLAELLLVADGVVVGPAAVPTWSSPPRVRT
jgi:hypothetical protein